MAPPRLLPTVESVGRHAKPSHHSGPRECLNGLARSRMALLHTMNNCPERNKEKAKGKFQEMTDDKQRRLNGRYWPIALRHGLTSVSEVLLPYFLSHGLCRYVQVVSKRRGGSTVVVISVFSLISNGVDITVIVIKQSRHAWRTHVLPKELVFPRSHCCSYRRGGSGLQDVPPARRELAGLCSPWLW